jgi:osmotically inducible protein OsmC
MKPLYTARARAIGGRDGRTTSLRGTPDHSLKPPPELGGPAEQDDVTNPEELLALGYAGCFLNALQLVARSQKISARRFEMESGVTLGARDDGSFNLAVELHGTLPQIEPEQAAKLMRQAHKVCPFSRAMTGNIEMQLFLGEEPVPAA